MRLLLPVVLPALFGTAVIACGPATEDELNVLMNTQRGPAKLRAALEDSSLDIGLRAVAARNLVRLEQWSVVRAELSRSSGAERAALVERLMHKLWEDARVSETMAKPTALQATAKDALFELREHASVEQAKAIDSYLLAWLVPYYEGRAELGRFSGESVVRTIGAGASRPLLERARTLLDTKADPRGAYPRVGDNLLRGIAASATSESVSFLLELGDTQQRDSSLATRGLAALVAVYAPRHGDDRADPSALAIHRESLAAIVADRRRGRDDRERAARLLGAAGQPP